MTNESFFYERLCVGSSSFFKIANYQRNYSWCRTQWRDLWEDLKRVSEDDSITSHFMGNIITYKSKDAKITEIVDGQQRIVTFLILCNAIKNYCINKQVCVDYATEISGLLYSKSKKRHRVQLNPKDMYVYELIYSNVFNKSSLTEDIRDNRIYKCYDYFYKIVRSYSDVERLINGIQKLSMSENMTDNQQEASIAFARINATGCIMEDAEKLNAFIHQKILKEVSNKDVQTDYIQRWINLYNSESMSSDFLLYTYTYYIDKRVGQHLNGYSNMMMETVKNDKISVPDLITGLERIYNFWNNPSPNNRKVRKFIESTKILNIPVNGRKEGSFQMPKLIIDMLYREYDWGCFDSSVALSILKMVEGIIIRKMICHYSVRSLTLFDSAFSSTLLKCDGKSMNFVDNFIRELNDHASAYMAKDNKHFSECFLEKRYTNKKLVTLLLYRINEFLSMYDEVSPTGLTIEHIIPKCKAGELKDKIGNLTLLPFSTNSQIQDEPFIVKKELYGRTQLKINEYLKDLDTFDFNSVEERSKFLLDIVLKIYPSV